MCVKGLSCIGDAIDIVRMWAEVRVGLVTPWPENTINTMRMTVEVRVGVGDFAVQRILQTQ